MGVTLALAGLLFISATTVAGGPPAGVSTDEWASIQVQIEAERHHVTESDRPGSLYRADSPSQRFTAHIGDDDVVIVPSVNGEPAWEISLRLTAWGAADDLQPVHPGAAFAESNRVELRRGPLTEWYLNTAMGLEQGFTIYAPPGDGIDELVLEMTIGGDLTAVMAGDRKAVTFRHGDSNTAVAYSGLEAWDAVEEPLEARMELAGHGTRLRLVVGVAGSAWPITVDPIFTQVAKLSPTPDLDAHHAEFGRSVAIDGDLMIAGLRGVQDGGASGSAHVYARDQGGPGEWGHVAELVAPDATRGQNFGYSVSISGDTAIVGAPQDSPYSSGGEGSAYVFQRDHGGSNTWGLIAKIEASDGYNYNRFGCSVAISGEYAVIGAFYDDEIDHQAGAAYVFHRDHPEPDAWGQVAKLTASDGASQDFFGVSVAISGDTVIVGALGDDDFGAHSGAAYVFRQSQGGSQDWGQVVKITASDGSALDHFGASVSISDPVAIVGAFQNGENGLSSGAAYVFHRDHGGSGNWGQITKLTPADGGVLDWFGASVAIDNGTALVGAPNDGSAYIFQQDQGGPDYWGQVAKLVGTNETGSGEVFGYSAAISGGFAVIGDSRFSDEFDEEGSTYVFRRNLGGPNSWGQSAQQACPPVYAARSEYFGQTVAISEETVVVGAPGDDDFGLKSGSAYVFQRTGDDIRSWALVAKLNPDTADAYDYFGCAVAIDSNTVVVGADGDESGGSAFVFQRDQGGPNTWGQVALLKAQDGSGGDSFGVSLDIDSEIIVVGASGDDDNGFASGSAYFFRRDQVDTNSWSQSAKVTPADGAAGDQFGCSVSVSNTTAIIGAFGSDANGPDSGSAYVFERDQGGPDSWGQVATIVPVDIDSEDFFGESVAIDGDRALVGASGDDDLGTESGSAYLFQRDQGGPDSWGQTDKLVPAGIGVGDRFGCSVSIRSDTAVVGAFRDDEIATDAGAAYVFRHRPGSPIRWRQVTKLTTPDGWYGDRFGLSVSVSNDTTVVGANCHDVLGNDSGAAYVFATILVRSSTSDPRRVTP